MKSKNSILLAEVDRLRKEVMDLSSQNQKLEIDMRWLNDSHKGMTKVAEQSMQNDLRNSQAIEKLDKEKEELSKIAE